MGKDTFNLSDDDRDEDEIDEGQDDGEEGDEGDDDLEPGSAAHRRARGDTVGEGDDDEEEGSEESDGDDSEEGEEGGGSGRDRPTAEELAELADDELPAGVRKRMATLTQQRDQAIESSLKLVERMAGGAQAPAAAPAPPRYDFEAAEQRYADAILEGNKEDAAKIRAEIRAEERKADRADWQQETSNIVAGALEQDRAMTAVAEGFEKYPFFDDTNKAFNQKALDHMVMYRERFELEGLTKSAAIAKAFKVIGPIYADKLGSADEDDEPPQNRKAVAKKPAARRQDDDEGDEDEPNANRRTREMLRQRRLANARAENRQPNALGRQGTAHRDKFDESNLDPDEMTDAQLEELKERNPKAYARLRGDVLG